MAKFIPRLFCDMPLSVGVMVPLTVQQSHYLLHVLRLQQTDAVLAFNGRDGEFVAQVKAAKNNSYLKCESLHRPQPPTRPKRVLALSNLKPDKFHLACEKATELGATNIVPLLCDNTQLSTIKTDKAWGHIVDAAEQSDRLDVPQLHTPQKINAFLQTLGNAKYAVGLERMDNAPASYNIHAMQGCIIGPEGGFSMAERNLLQTHPNLTCMALGDTVLRAETAAIAMLSLFLMPRP